MSVFSPSTAGIEPRVIPTDSFMTPDDPSQTVVDDNLMKRLQALHGNRLSPSHSPSQSAESVDYEDDLEDLLSEEAEDGLADDDDLIREMEEEEEDKLKGEESSIQNVDTDDVFKETDCTKSDNNTVCERDSPTSVENNDETNVENNDETNDTNADETSAEEIQDNSTEEIFNKDDDVELKDDEINVEVEEGNVEEVVIISAMRGELEDAIHEGADLKQRLEEEVKLDTDIGEGRVRRTREEDANLDDEVGNEEDDEVDDRRSSADSGVQEDRTDGDESSETQSAVISPVTDVEQSNLHPDVPNILLDDSETKSEIVCTDSDVSQERTKSCDESDEDVERTGVIEPHRTDDGDKDGENEDETNDVLLSEDVGERTDIPSEGTEGESGHNLDNDGHGLQDGHSFQDGQNTEDDHNLEESQDAAHTNDKLPVERTDDVKADTDKSTDSTRTLDQNANENDDKDHTTEEELSGKPGGVRGRKIELELSDADGERKGDIDGALDETEAERINRLKEEALARHLKTISADVHTYMGKFMG